MPIARLDWRDVPQAARSAVEAVDPISRVEPVSGGENSAVAVLLHTSRGLVFCKGLRNTDRWGAASLRREEAVAPYVAGLSPRLLWTVQAEGWTFLGFEHVAGRHASYAPGSSDLPAVIETLRTLGRVQDRSLPPLVRPAQLRWAEFVDGDPSWLAGDCLLHTDWNPENVIISGGMARLVDWAWPTRGPAYVDSCCLAVRLIAAGHTPDSAEAQLGAVEGWQTAPRRVVNEFVLILHRMWRQIATQDPARPWKQAMATAVTRWRQHRWS